MHYDYMYVCMYICVNYVYMSVLYTPYILGRCVLCIYVYYVCILYASMLMVLASSRGTIGRGENHAGQCVSVTPTARKRFNQLVL